MRIALWQKTQIRGQQLQAVNGDRAVHQTRSIHFDGFSLKRSKMFVEASVPDQVDPVSGLQNRLHLAGAATAHQTEMPAMRACHHLEDGAGFAMLAGAEYDSLVAPFHGGRFDAFCCEIKKQTGQPAKPPAKTNGPRRVPRAARDRLEVD